MYRYPNKDEFLKEEEKQKKMVAWNSAEANVACFVAGCFEPNPAQRTVHVKRGSVGQFVNALPEDEALGYVAQETQHERDCGQ